jgi:hypothetical protein
MTFSDDNEQIDPASVADALDLMRTEMVDGFTLDGTKPQIEALTTAARLLRELGDTTNRLDYPSKLWECHLTIRDLRAHLSALTDAIAKHRKFMEAQGAATPYDEGLWATAAAVQPPDSTPPLIVCPKCGSDDPARHGEPIVWNGNLYCVGPWHGDK